MKLFKKLMTILITMALLSTLTACASYSSKAKKNIDAYMKTMKNLTEDNYLSWVNENLGNPYLGIGVDLDRLKTGQITYFIKCLSKVKYEIANIDENNRMAELNVTYIDSSEYITNMFTQLLTYAFSEDYTEEGENQIYLDVMNSITEDKFVDTSLYFALNEDGSIADISNDAFDIVTAGLYRIMLGDPNEIKEQQNEGFSEEELLANIDVSYEIFNDSRIFVTFTNHNDIPVFPIADFIFYDANGNYVIQSQANMDVLPAGATNYSVAYNELNDEVVRFEVEMQVGYFDPDRITFFDESVVPYEIKNEEREDEIDIVFTNNTDETVDICGSFFVYDANDNLVNVDTIYLTDIEPGQSDYTWFYLDCDYDEEKDTCTFIPYGRVEVYPIIHTYANYSWAH